MGDLKDLSNKKVEDRMFQISSDLFINSNAKAIKVIGAHIAGHEEVTSDVLILLLVILIV